MAYADFDLERVIHDFELAGPRDADLFAAVEPVEPSAYLTEWLAESSPVAFGMSTTAEAQGRRGEPCSKRRQGRGEKTQIPAMMFRNCSNILLTRPIA